MLETLHAWIGQPVQDHRSLPILTIYLTSCAALTIKILLNIYRGYHTHKTQSNWRRSYGSQFTIFIALSILSITTTWYYMFAFFAHSYRSWEARQSPMQRALIEVAPHLLKWEMWLRDSKLFREAWESVSATPARTWWSGQIFLWTIGWSLFLGVMGRRYHIPNVWMYMLLGQIVAISFAQNLFFITVIVSGPSSVPSTKLTWTPPVLLDLAPVVISGLGAAATPLVANTPYFMPVLAIPHLLLFVPGLLSPRLLPQGWGAYIAQPTQRYASWYKWLFAIAVIIQARSLYSVVLDAPSLLGASVVDLGRRLVDTLLEHPAVSSVGWDVVCCTISWTIWMLLRGGFQEMLE
ncbi:hypothetical protein PDIG_46480 [Penicillium digitatum PHI26]|uniref:Uncharacterized protein n=2 Tax=Penicillium digitatum TaxID=36651 RepID=K9FUB4_PEND2|nr:hypothetical protein PDIP_18410 [Penicillium digitatum Pd1]EKV12112.1 hypothetical protein PDIG_46480 [Penicillium digitatum PHI26]EKV20180.1 hypothetical protein PDIP_18410 [Penicillium digitatum Pd1]KAG0160461.1 hypothetical protein PDIDSM_7990 [Penicillium digitatum]